jgi:rRNA-processing protein FCF1
LYLLKYDLQQQLEKMKNDAIPSEVQAELEAIDTEFAPKIKTIEDKLAQVVNKVKQAVLEQGSTLKGNAFMAVWSKPRTSWDTKLLDRLAEKYPEINLAKTKSKPSVSIKQIK